MFATLGGQVVFRLGLLEKDWQGNAFFWKDLLNHDHQKWHN